MHAKTIIAAAGLLLAWSCNAWAQTFTVRLTSYDIRASILPNAPTLHATVACTALWDDHAPDVCVLLNAAARIRSVTLSAAKKNRSADVPFYRAGGDTLRLTLPPTALRVQDSARLVFDYDVPIEALNDTILILDRGYRWYPLVSNQVAPFTLEAEVPVGYFVLSSGERIRSGRQKGSGMRFLWKSARPVFKIPLVVASSRLYRMHTATSPSGIPLAMYSLTSGDTLSKHILEEAGRMMAFLSSAVGSYSYPGLTLIEVPSFEGMNIASGFVMIGSSFLEMMAHGNDDGLRLAVAEQWIGAGVFGHYGEPGFWFTSLSMPHYLRLLYMRSREGEEAYEKALRQPMKQYEPVAGSDRDIPIIQIAMPDTREKGLVLYAKGPFILSRIHRAMGEKAWSALWRELYAAYCGRVLGLDEFRAFILRHDAGGKAAPMFDRMLHETGTPKEEPL